MNKNPYSSKKDKKEITNIIIDPTNFKMVRKYFKTILLINLISWIK